MPQTEGCPLGEANKANIQSLKEAFEDFRDEMRLRIDEIAACVDNLTTHFSKKPSWGVLILVAGLSNLFTTMLILYLKAL